MLNIAQLEAIESKLYEVSNLVNQFETNDFLFVDNVNSWIKGIEEILNRSRLLISGKVAALRGKLLNVIKGGDYPQFEVKGKRTRRKVLFAVGIDVVEQVTSILSSSIQGDRMRIDEAERIGLQIVSIARYIGLDDQLVNSKINNPYEKMVVFMSMLKNHEATKQGVIQFEGLLGQNDSIFMLSRLLNDNSKHIQQSFV